METDKSNEDQWFSANEQELLKAAKLRHEKTLKEESNKEQEELKQLHWLKCPKCGGDMEEINYDGIEIDKCKKCEGVFFDAGELDELLLLANDKKKSIFRKIVSPIFS
jgi:uncharacterized protein